jgi:hypothetical protein
MSSDLAADRSKYRFVSNAKPADDPPWRQFDIARSNRFGVA